MAHKVTGDFEQSDFEQSDLITLGGVGGSFIPQQPFVTQYRRALCLTSSNGKVLKL